MTFVQNRQKRAGTSYTGYDFLMYSCNDDCTVEMTFSIDSKDMIVKHIRKENAGEAVLIIQHGEFYEHYREMPIYALNRIDNWLIEVHGYEDRLKDADWSEDGR